MKRTHLWVILISILLGQGVCSALAQTPKTAKIVFTSNRDGNSEIYIMNVNGSEQKNLTQHSARDGAPVWSQTGEHIAFHSDRHGLRDIYIMDADGKNVQKLFKDLVYREFPTWSPDGKMLAYYRWDGDERAIYIAHIEEQREEHIASAGPLAGFPDWSPDGSEIIFTFRFEHARGTAFLRVVNINTKAETTLFEPDEPASLFHADWAPDGKKIAFSWLKKGVYVLDGSNKAEKLTAGTFPAWGPRGDELLYVERGQIFTFNLESRISKQLTGGAGTINVEPNWFDPATLPVQPNPKLLTTQWSKLKEK